MSSVMFLHLSSTLLIINITKHKHHNIIEHTKPKILVSTLKRQVSRGYINDQVVGH